MKIAALYYYPVKSLPGFAADVLVLDRFGPAQDRRWMIVGADGRFVSQRKYPALALVQPEIADQSLWITVPGQGRFPVEASNALRSVTIWRDLVEAVVARSGPGRALSEYLGVEVDLVYMADDCLRPARHDSLADEHPVSFADGFPFLLTSEASLADLNRRTPWQAEMQRFRPNIVIGDAEPWAEDGWSELSLGEVTVRLVKPCSRCIMTTVDPETGHKSPDGEPLKTLTSFRRTPEGVTFGINAIHREGKQLSVGDPVTVLATKESLY